MPTYKLTYFNVTGLAEPIRFMLNYLGEDFEDNRLTLAEWPSIKPSTPFGKAPVLEIDSEIVHQSTAITRYLGKQANLAGKDDWEAFQIDIVVDTFHDFRLGNVSRKHVAIYSFSSDLDEASKEKKRETFINETMPFYLGRFDELVKENNGYLANGALSWGDIYFVAASEYINHMIGCNIFEKYENLRSLRDTVYAIPEIQKWLEIRPKAIF